MRQNHETKTILQAEYSKKDMNYRYKQEEKMKMEKLVVKILTVLFIISFIIAIPVSIIKGRVDNMTLDATYSSKTDHTVKIRFTEKEGDTPEGYAHLYDGHHIAYLYVDGKEYYGIYKFDLAKKFDKVIRMNFYGYPDNDIAEGSTYVLFKFSKKKLNVIETRDQWVYGEGIFADNQIFVKKTWWNTWGKKLIIILAILFAIWLFKDVPQKLKDKEMMQEIKNDLKENVKKGMNDIIEDLKDPYNTKNDTNKS